MTPKTCDEGARSQIWAFLTMDCEECGEPALSDDRASKILNAFEAAAKREGAEERTEEIAEFVRVGSHDLPTVYAHREDLADAISARWPATDEEKP